MSKFEHILASTGHSAPKPRSGMKSSRARVLLLTLTIMLIAFAFLTQPQIRAAVEPWLGQLPGI